jgi:hypothetical protein
LGRTVLYCDTDSVIYIQKVAEDSKVVTWNSLVDLINELDESGSGSFIQEFVSGGPKKLRVFRILPLCR